MAVVKESPDFKVVDNVVMGTEVPLRHDVTSIGQVVLDALKSKPDFVGQVDGVSGVQNTYREMREKSVKCALWLKRQGIRAGDIVGICVGNLLDAYVPLFASFYINAVANPWDEELNVATATYFLTLMRPKVVFVEASSAVNVRDAAKKENMDVKVVVFEELQGFENLSEILESVETSEVENFQCTKVENADETSVICCSSGTSGLPKGTMLSHFSLINFTHVSDLLDFKNHVTMWMPPIRWHYGLSLVVNAIIDYSTRIVVGHYIDDDQLCQIMEKYNVSWFACGPGVPLRFLKHDIIKKYRLPSMKVFLIGGSHFKKEMHEALRNYLPHAAVIQTYGMTDIGGLTTRQRKDGKLGSVGVVGNNVHVKVVHTETGKVLGPNETGEIWAKAPYAMTGYYNNPEATKKMLDSDGFLHSGDIGYYDEDGEFFIVDRISDFIFYKSINVPPAPIENLLQSHPAVLEAAVVSVPHETDDGHPIAFVSRVPGKEVTEQELIDLVERDLEYYSRLRAGVKFVDEFPRTPTGKIAKSKLREIAATYQVKK